MRVWECDRTLGILEAGVPAAFAEDNFLAEYIMYFILKQSR